jgi:hypothetical protein
MLRKWLRLIVGCVAIAAFIAGLHVASPQLGGSTGAIVADNQEHNREVYAYVYSEVGEIDEFLDDECGRYGRAAVAAALAESE